MQECGCCGKCKYSLGVYKTCGHHCWVCPDCFKRYKEGKGKCLKCKNMIRIEADRLYDYDLSDMTYIRTELIFEYPAIEKEEVKKPTPPSNVLIKENSSKVRSADTGKLLYKL